MSFEESKQREEGPGFGLKREECGLFVPQAASSERMGLGVPID